MIRVVNSYSKDFGELVLFSIGLLVVLKSFRYWLLVSLLLYHETIITHIKKIQLMITRTRKTSNIRNCVYLDLCSGFLIFLTYGTSESD